MCFILAQQTIATCPSTRKTAIDRALALTPDLGKIWCWEYLMRESLQAVATIERPASIQPVGVALIAPDTHQERSERSAYKILFYSRLTCYEYSIRC